MLLVCLFTGYSLSSER